MYISLTNRFPTLSATQMLLIKTALAGHDETVIAIDEQRDIAVQLICTNGTDVQTLPYNFDAALEASFNVGKIDGFKETYAGRVTFVIFPATS